MSALDPHRALTQSRLSVWTNEAGLPQSSINAIVQTADGYLWIGTEEGLVRFDGMRFVVRDAQNAPALRTPFVSALYEAPDRTLWIGTYGGGIARLRNGSMEAFHPELFGSDRIRNFHTARNGLFFIAMAGGGLVRIDGEKITRFTMSDGLPSDRIWMVTDDGSGGLWLATQGGGVVRWKDGRVLQRITTREGLPNDAARALLIDPDGTMWIGTDGGGVAGWRAGAIVRTITTRDGLPNDFVRTLLRDRDGRLWIGTDAGLARWTGERAESMGVEEGLPSAITRSLAEDREGNLWVGMLGGLVRLSDTRVLPYTRKEGLPAGQTSALLEDRSGRVWVGTAGGGLCQVLPGPVQCRTTAHGLPNNAVAALIESRDGSLWVGTDGGGAARLRDGVFVDRIDSRSAGLPNDRVRALVENAQGDLWVSTSAGLALVRGGKATSIAAFKDRQLRSLLALPDGSLLVGTDGAGLWRVSGDGTRVSLVAQAGRGLESDRVFSLAPDAGGNGVWIGTSGGGLARLDLAGNSVRSLTRRAGLHDDVVFQVLDAGRRSDLWLTSNRGVYRVGRDRVLAALEGARTDLSGTVYGTIDGMPSAECVGSSPGVMRARDGRIWVATVRGVAVIDPNSNERNEVAPLVHVEEAIIDGVAAHAGSLNVHSGAERLEIRYTALGLRAPELVTFRYKLDGYDSDWVEAGTGRVATYTKLAPGQYTFRVSAANEDGVPSAGEARLAVGVAPLWYETTLARLAAIALLGLVVYAAVMFRLRRMRQHARILEATVQERTAQLRDSEQRALSASQAKSAFLANMSHELRTPLNAILGFAQLLAQEKGRAADDQQKLDVIMKSGEHLLGLINDILSLSKIEAGGSTLDERTFDTKAMLAALEQMFALRASAKRLSLRFDVAGSMPAAARGDDGKLRQVLINLLGNAVKFTLAGGEVSLRAAWENGRASFSVSDTGPGIPAEEIEQLFEPFVQSQGDAMREGTGLGLPISRSFVRLMGGEIVVQSTPGHGATFSFDVPLPAADADAVTRVQSEPRRIAALAAGQPAWRIIVADDAVENRQLLHDFLAPLGFEVRTVSNGQEALDGWREWHPHLIWMDIRMPVLDGLAAVRIIRGEEMDGQHTPILALTASAFEHDRERILAAGCDDFVAKPFLLPVILQKLERYLAVQWRYERAAGEQAATDLAATALTPERIGRIPPDLRDVLQEALLRGDIADTSVAVDRIRIAIPEIGPALSEMVRAYRFDELQSLLDMK